MSQCNSGVAGCPEDVERTAAEFVRGVPTTALAFWPSPAINPTEAG